MTKIIFALETLTGGYGVGKAARAFFTRPLLAVKSCETIGKRGPNRCKPVLVRGLISMNRSSYCYLSVG